jgi:hypothetical protein
MTKPLSPAAQAVLDAFLNTPGEVPMPMWDYGRDLAAVLRAAADQVVPKTPTLSYPTETFGHEDYELGVWVANDDTRTELLAIAAELEATVHD